MITCATSAGPRRHGARAVEGPLPLMFDGLNPVDSRREASCLTLILQLVKLNYILSLLGTALCPIIDFQ